MNRVFLIGNLSKDPAFIEFEKGSVCNLDVAVQREYGDDGADFFRVKVFGKQGESCNKYLSKGSKIGVDGRIENRQYTDKDGVKKTVTEIIANRVEFLSTKKEETEPRQTTLEEIPDNDLPF